MWWSAADLIGEAHYVALVGWTLGAAFGVFAAINQFCIRSAVLSVFDGNRAAGLSWIAALVTAVVGVQALEALSMLDLSSARQATTQGSLSGAAVGGLLLGIGISVARGCPSRQVILAAKGNFRALITLTFVGVGVDLVTRGTFAPGATRLLRLWTLEPAHRTIGQVSSVLAFTMVLGLVLSAAAAGRMWFSHQFRTALCSGSVIGSLVAATWLFSASASRQGFVVSYPSGISFAGPIFKIWLGIVGSSFHWYNFGIALVCGTFVGALAIAVLRGEFALVGFSSTVQVLARMSGGILIGVGASLAGGCSIGSLSGAAILSVTNCLAILAMCSGVALYGILERRAAELSQRSKIALNQVRTPAALMCRREESP